MKQSTTLSIVIESPLLYGVLKYKPAHFSRLLDMRGDLRMDRVAITIRRSVDALMRSREIVARSRNLLEECKSKREENSSRAARSSKSWLQPPMSPP